VQTAPPGFHLVYLPFADDIRQLSLPEPQRASDAQIEAARAVVTKLRFAYSPDKIENPDLQKHWRNIEAIALKRPEPDEFTDFTAPNLARIEKKAGKLIAAFQSLTYPEGYDPKGAAPPAKRPKREPAPDAADVDMAQLAREGKVQTLKVPDLKSFLQSVGVSVSSKKKADLVQDVIDHFNK